ncbi:MAG: DNA polymerase III subunit gamma/tau, partial [Ilumatobacteraceae bacterium]
MATQSLYRRYRPRRFSEVKGQDHVVKALRTAVAEGREGQAYLFSGPRGTGKTTSARILAKVLNCANPIDGEPCCECESCLSVERGTSYDVHELDAASNNGVDAMRDLIEKASLGTPGRHKVYILDEVHMLSKAAEAALLKTLEEPPPHVVFVLATTDPQKMSDTIRSRTQHLQFHLLPPDTLAEHVRWVADDAGLEVSDAALDQVLRQGAGSARDALSALELVASIGDDGVETVPLDEFVEAMIDRDPGRALTMVAHAISIGRDPRTLTEELIGFMRNGFLCLMAPELVPVSGHHIDTLTDQASRLGAAGLVRGIETLGAALSDMRHAPDARVLLDVAAVQLTADSVAPDLGALLARLHRLEEQVAAGVTVAAPGVQDAPAAAADPVTGRAVLGGRARTATPTEPAVVAPEPAPSPEPSPSAASAAAPSTSASSAPHATELTSEVWEQTVRPALRG